MVSPKISPKISPKVTPKTENIEHLRRLLKVALLPIFGFALVNAVLCWGCAWIFYDRYEFSATFLGFGCGGIVIALCSYLYLLTSHTGGSEK